MTNGYNAIVRAMNGTVTKEGALLMAAAFGSEASKLKGKAVDTVFEQLWSLCDIYGRNCAAAAAEKEKEYVLRGGGQTFTMIGLCGFAWVQVYGNTAFARWAKKAGKMRKAYGGGVQYWVSLFDQSHEQKKAYAMGFAELLKAAGERAYGDDRLD